MAFYKAITQLDALAGLAFGVTIITAIRQMGKREDKSIAIGAMSLGRVTWFS